MKSRRKLSPWILPVLMLLFGALALLSGKYASAQGAPQKQGSAGNGWRSLVQLPTGSSASFTSIAHIKQSNGDWAVYTTSYYACGHCGFVDTDIHLKNVINGRQIDIKGARGTAALSGDPVSVQEVRFAEPYLLWYQPWKESTPADRFTPGQFDCTLCYYDVASGKGGSLADLVPSLQIPSQGQGQGQGQGQARPVALDPTGTGMALINVTPGDQNGVSRLLLANLKSGQGKEIVTGTVGQDLTARGVVINGDVIAWIPSTPGIENASVYVYNPTTGEASTPQALAGLNAYALHTNGKALFYNIPGPGASDLNSYDVATGRSGKVPGISDAFTYEVYGDLIATAPDKGRIVVRDLRDNHVVSDMTVPTEEQARQSLNATPAVALDKDKLLFSLAGLGSTGTVYAHMVGISWLSAPNPAFDSVWAKADAQVANRNANRSWLWGPVPIYTGWEPYAGLTGDKRQVRYYDKSRMEVNNPDAKPNDPYYVTNGLLVAEMIAGEVRLGETEISPTIACTLTVAGDPRKVNPLTPSYGALRGVASIEGDNTSPNRIGQLAAEAIDVNGAVSQERLNGKAAKYAAYIAQTGHNIPDVFWTYLQAMKGEYGYDWTYAMGYPITEAYWTQMRVGGKDYPVLIQAYQRRVMTYTPAFPTGWRVQQGNVGQHYFEWRYFLTASSR